MKISPEVLKWACDRATPSVGDLRGRHPKVAAWINGDAEPTLRQLEVFARAARVAVGYLFLPEPPEENLPIKDLRTVRSQQVRRPSPDLLDTIYACQQRQVWYGEYARRRHLPRCPLSRIAAIESSPKSVAMELERIIGFGVDERRAASDLDAAFRMFADCAESAGVLVMVGGTVGPNTKRLLNPDEFRGFALADDIAPIVFVNSKDTKAARMFTLAHELAHICLGESALSDATLNATAQDKIEVWCNRVAAEYLVPAAALSQLVKQMGNDVSALAKELNVSRPVILRRLLDTGVIDRDQFDRLYAVHVASYVQPPKDPKKKSGGSPYRTLRRRVSPLFASAVIGSALEGETLFTEAFRLLEVKNRASLGKLAELVGHEV